MNRAFAVLLLATLLHAGCVSSKVVSKVTIAELLEHKKAYGGRRVDVTGYYRCGPEMSALYQNQADAEHFRHESALHIMPFAKTGYEENLKLLREGTARVVGEFNYSPLGVGHLNQWPAEIRDLELFESMDTNVQPDARPNDEERDDASAPKRSISARSSSSVTSSVGHYGPSTSK